MNARVRTGSNAWFRRHHGATQVQPLGQRRRSDGVRGDPYVKFPTRQNDLGNNSLEGGLILPLVVALQGEFYLGFTSRFDAVRDEDERGYHTEFINSIAVGHELFGNLFGYVEFFSAVSTERDAPWVGTFDMGLQSDGKYSTERRRERRARSLRR